MIQKQLSQVLFITGGTLTILGAVVQLLQFPSAPYIFSLGSALIIFIQAINAWDSSNDDKNKQRIKRLGLFTSLFLALAAYLMFTSSNSWVVCVLIYALTSFYLSFRGN